MYLDTKRMAIISTENKNSIWNFTFCRLYTKTNKG